MDERFTLYVFNACECTYDPYETFSLFLYVCVYVFHQGMTPPYLKNFSFQDYDQGSFHKFYLFLHFLLEMLISCIDIFVLRILFQL